MKLETARPVHLKDYRPPAYLIDRVNLDVSLEPTRTRVRSKLAIRPNPKATGRREQLKLDGEQLELGDIALDGQPLGKKDYKLTDMSLTLTKTPTEPFTLEITTFVNPEANKALQGIYRSNNVYTSQCEAEGFRRITYFLDRPDVLATYTVRIDADPHAAPVLLSNGNLLERRHARRRHGTTRCGTTRIPSRGTCSRSSPATSPPMQLHLPHHVGPRGRPRIYVEHGKKQRAAWAMDSLKRAMRWDEQRFGREYDLDVFMIVCRRRLQHGRDGEQGPQHLQRPPHPRRARDGDRRRSTRRSRASSRHEYFHNWTGNRVTCRDWFQLSLKEGLTVFRDQEFSADERSRDRRSASTTCAPLRREQFAEDAGPDGASGAPRRATSRSTTSTRRRSTKRAPRWSA